MRRCVNGFTLAGAPAGRGGGVGVCLPVVMAGADICPSAGNDGGESRAKPAVRARLLICAPPGIRGEIAAIAQLVEHVIRNDGVGGSNPSCGTRSSDMNECVHLAVGTRRRFAAWTPVPSPSIL